MSLRKMKDGRWKMRWLRNGRKSGSYGQMTLPPMPKAKAQDVYDRVLSQARERREGVDQGRVDLTFSEIAEEFRELHGPKLSEAGRERVDQVIAKHLDPFFGSKRVRDITAADVERYRNLRSTAKASPATINREWTVFRSILNRAVAWGTISDNPIRRGAVRSLKVESGRLVYLEVEEWRKFIGAFDDAGAWRKHMENVRTLGPVKFSPDLGTVRRFGGGLRPDSEATANYLERLRETMPVFKALLFTGCRLGEILALRWEDVDLKNQTVRIHQQKTSKAKNIPIGKSLKELLSSTPSGIGKAHVFTHESGRPFYRAEVQRAFAVARKLSGIRAELTPHTLRHTFASWLAIKGTPLRTIQELLGHSDVRMTIRYSHLSPAHLRSALDSIDETLSESGVALASPGTPIGTNQHQSAPKRRRA